MLILARKQGESVVIGDGIEITVVEIKGDQVRLGIQAPVEIPIYRKEIYAEILLENRHAVESKADLEKLGQVWDQWKKKGKPDE